MLQYLDLQDESCMKNAFCMQFNNMHSFMHKTWPMFSEKNGVKTASTALNQFKT